MSGQFLDCPDSFWIIQTVSSLWDFGKFGESGDFGESDDSGESGEFGESVDFSKCSDSGEIAKLSDSQIKS